MLVPESVVVTQVNHLFFLTLKRQSLLKSGLLILEVAPEQSLQLINCEQQTVK